MLTNARAVPLPEKDTHIIALICDTFKQVDKKTGKTVYESCRCFLGDGEIAEDNHNEYLFDYCDGDSYGQVAIPLCGYVKEVFDDTDIDDTCDLAEVTTEYMVLDYTSIETIKIETKNYMWEKCHG